MNDQINELLVVLGHTNDLNGKLSDDAHSRVQVAHSFVQRHERPKRLAIVATGGVGDHFNKSDVPHGRLVSEQIRNLGIGDATLLSHIHSCGTLEDALGVLRIIRETTNEIAAITVVSSAYHMNRVKFVFSRLFPFTFLKFLDDGKQGNLQQRNHEARALALLKKSAPRFGWLAENIDDGSNSLGEEIRHYDNLSYLGLAASFSLILIWSTSHSEASTLQGLVLSFAPATLISLVFFGVYWRLAGTAASARRTLQQVSFLTGQPHLGTSNNFASRQTPKITTSAMLAWLAAWATAFALGWSNIPGP